MSSPASRPLRALGRAAHALGLSHQAGPGPGRPTARAYDSWLEHFHGEQLQQIDAACAGAGPEAFALFRGLDVELWALLLTQQYELYPNIRALLPGVPDPALQEIWNGASGVSLAAQTQGFYRKLLERFHTHYERPLQFCRVLDFGCGWARLTRLLARDVEPGNLYGCDPVQQILEVCHRTGVPAVLARSEFVPDRLPFEQDFELVFAFSVFTHLSEAAHLSCLRALHESQPPGGILVLTVRPPAYLQLNELMHPLLESLGTDHLARLKEPLYLFAPHPTAPLQAPVETRESPYGEAVVTLPYVRRRWSTMFELLDVDFLLCDPYQVILTLRRK